MKKEYLIIAAILIGAVLFRLWLTSLAPQPFWSDQQEYETYVGRIFNHPWTAVFYPLLILASAVGLGYLRKIGTFFSAP